MVAVDHEGVNLRFAQPVHLVREEQAGVVVLPITVVKVAGEHDKVHLLIQRQVHQILEGPARRSPEMLDGGAFVLLEPFQRTIDVQIRSMDELEHLSLPTSY